MWGAPVLHLMPDTHGKDWRCCQIPLMTGASNPQVLNVIACQQLNDQYQNHTLISLDAKPFPFTAAGRTRPTAWALGAAGCLRGGKSAQLLLVTTARAKWSLLQMCSRAGGEAVRPEGCEGWPRGRHRWQNF